MTPEGPFGGHPAQASAPGEPPALEQVIFAGSRSIAAPRDAVLLSFGEDRCGWLVASSPPAQGAP